MDQRPLAVKLGRDDHPELFRGRLTNLPLEDRANLPEAVLENDLLEVGNYEAINCSVCCCWSFRTGCWQYGCAKPSADLHQEG
jgi:hypothetical protein